MPSARGFTIFLLSLISILIFTLFIKADNSHAQVNFTSNRAQFLNDNSNLILQTFEKGNVTPGVFTGCNTPVDSNSNDDCFSPGQILPGIAFSTDPDGGETNLVGPFLFSNLNPKNVLSPDGSKQKSVITFPGNSVKAVGLEVGCLFDQGVGAPCTGQTLDIQVFGAGDELLGETTVPADSNFDTFVGITSDAMIERITFIDSDLITHPSFNGLESVYFPNQSLFNVPTLSEWGMIAAAGGLILVGAFFVLRRKRALS